MSLAEQLQVQNDLYWRVRNRVKAKQNNLKNSDVSKKDKTRYETKRLIDEDEILQLPCQICGEEKVEVHHLDYSDPWNIQFLCHEHHLDWHKNNTPIY